MIHVVVTNFGLASATSKIAKHVRPVASTAVVQRPSIAICVTRVKLTEASTHAESCSLLSTDQLCKVLSASSVHALLDPTTGLLF